MAAATGTSWKHLPLPARIEPLGFTASFTQDEAARLRHGLVPADMDDKWFIYCEDGWLRFHRSWTGMQIFALRLAPDADGAEVVESWVNRDPAQYKATDTATDCKQLRFLIDALLLQRPDAVFPATVKPGEGVPGLEQHVFVGRGFPETSAG